METNSLTALVDNLRTYETEQEWFEFKENWFEAKTLGEYISALSNSSAYLSPSSIRMAALLSCSAFLLARGEARRNRPRPCTSTRESLIWCATRMETS